MHFRFTPAVAVLLALALPAVADAATKSVSMGTPRQSQRTFQSAVSDVNAFFPNRVVIAAGDSIRFVPAGFHTVDLPVRGRGPQPIFTPTGQAIAGQADPAGAAFWFNGRPTLGFNPALVTSGFGKRFAYTGAKRVDTGLPLAENPRPMTVRFPRAGTYTYYCDVHTGMKGTVVVRQAGANVPAASDDSRRARTQTSDALSVARSLGSTTSPAGVVKVGAAGRGGVERFAFFPSTLTVPVGTVLRFTMTPGSREIHTATTGPGNPETEPSSFLGQLEASLNSPSPNQAVFYPSDAPGTLANLTPTLHGNGFWSSGVMDAASSTAALPRSSTVRFGAPGAYQFYCMIHPFMHATITAQ